MEMPRRQQLRPGGGGSWSTFAVGTCKATCCQQQQSDDRSLLSVLTFTSARTITTSHHRTHLITNERNVIQLGTTDFPHAIMAAEASSSSSPSSLPSLSAAPGAPLIVVAYDLRDSSNAYASLASATVEMNPAVRIDKLRESVFAANANTLRGRDYTQLDVYPPGSTDWTDRCAAADAEDDIGPLLPGPDITDRRRRRFTVVARPLPSFGGARGRSSHSPQRALQCHACLHVAVPSLTLPTATNISSAD
jgi:hypothetical protein